jgi:hypothetical protein
VCGCDTTAFEAAFVITAAHETDEDETAAGEFYVRMLLKILEAEDTSMIFVISSFRVEDGVGFIAGKVVALAVDGC